MRFVAVIPAAPALLPRLTGGPVQELEPVRGAVRRALIRLSEELTLSPGPLVVVAPGAATRRPDPACTPTLSGYGAPDPRSSTGTRRPPATTPGLALALELLREAGAVVPGSVPPGSVPPGSGSPSSTPANPTPRPILMEVATDEDPSVCLRLGAELEAEAGPDGVWLVLGDGSSRRNPKAPGAFDPEALPFDDAIAEALAQADLTTIRGLDPALAGKLMVAGRAPWQILAAAVGAITATASTGTTATGTTSTATTATGTTATGTTATGTTATGTTATGTDFRVGYLFHDAPLGVGYFTSVWSLGPAHG